MKRNTFLKSLYWRISAAFLLILLLLGLAYVLITTLASNRYYQEMTQRLNANVAEHLLVEVPPFLDGKVNEEALGKIMHSMMAVNPSIEVYLLDPEGEILSFVVLDKKVKLNRVDIKPVRNFIEAKGSHFVLGDDPRNPGKKTVFSATAVKENGIFMGYVYIVLLSEEYDNISSALLGSFWMRVGAYAFSITMMAAILIGLLLIWLLTKNIRVIAHTFRQFENGDLLARIPEQNMKGELKLLSHTFNDMADTILLNIDKLKEVDTLRRELIANVSHDLRSPLAVIHGYVETLLIKDDNLTPEDRKHYLETILNGSEKLKRLVSDLFELSKLEARQIELRKETFFINELLQDTVQQYHLETEKKQIRIESEISTSVPMVLADLTLMERVLQNLVSNAVQYTPEKGTIYVNVRKKESNVEVEVRNTGEGIPTDDLPMIFDHTCPNNLSFSIV
ncbi:MAG: HAMP domain-containing sensor histidine kinase [Bacteroidales bacterium]|nr:HAMP domain-containing sensor histidine kinase [Bacteroidales bacterium]